MYLLGSNIYVLIKDEFVIPFKDQNVLFGMDGWIMILDIHIFDLVKLLLSDNVTNSAVQDS